MTSTTAGATTADVWLPFPADEIDGLPKGLDYLSLRFRRSGANRSAVNTAIAAPWR
ncbi:hypothetical protein SMICM304S_10245 [Streptomyces microflavus]